MYVLVTFRRCYSSVKASAALRRPIFNVKHILNQAELYKESIVRRKSPPVILQNLEFILANRQREVDLSQEINGLKHKRSKLGQLMKEGGGKPSEEVVQQLRDAKMKLRALESERDELSNRIFDSVESLPNLLDPSVPQDINQGEVVEYINCDKDMEEVEAKVDEKGGADHKSICEKLGLVDFDTAARVSGSSWYYLVGDGALLEQALVQFGLSKAREHGYKLVTPPTIVRSEVVSACGFRPNDQNGEKQVYELADEGLSLTGTAEIPLGALHSSSTFPSHQEFPVKYVGVSRAYRAEAGSRGSSTRGLYRVHEFTKVELFHFTTPEKASQELESIRDFQTLVVKDLELSAKMINMPTSDLGSPALKKYDCEAWMPGRVAWGEITSCSNCGDYQARRLGIKFDNKGTGKPDYISTLNGTCLAVPRVMIAIIEQNYDPGTESIVIPKVLRPYMDGKDRIPKND